MAALNTSLTARRPSRLAEITDLDVTPVMNMFIILIPFLVSMAVFAHLAAHRFSLPADDAAGQARTAAELPLTLAVAVDRIVLAWGDREVAALAHTDGAFDQAELLTLLAAERTRRPDMEKIVVAVDDGVSAAGVVACLDQCRAAGFGDVGLAAGTNLDRAPDREVQP